jgi:ribonuclease P protein component
MPSFTKEERLCSKIHIDKVFETGKTISIPSFKLFWLRSDEQLNYPGQIVISVPKRNFKRAVDRNKLKRRIREAYRLNKHIFYSSAGSNSFYLMLVYTGRSIIEYKEVDLKIKELMSRLVESVNK